MSPARRTGDAAPDPDDRYADFESGVDLPDLAAVPAAVGRAAGEGTSESIRTRLGGKLTPVAPAKPAADPARPQAAASAPTAAEEVAEDAQTLRATSFAVPAALVKRLNEYKKAHAVTTADVLLDALEATESTLIARLGGASDSGGRFARPSRRGRRRDEGVLTQLHCRLLASNFAILDDLVTKTGATSRSQLVSAALTVYLDQQSG